MPISAQLDRSRVARFLGTANLDLIEAVFEPLRDNPFFAKDDCLRYVAANSAMARMCGETRPSSLYGRRAGEIFPSRLAIRYEAMDRQVLTQGEAVNDMIDLSVGADAEPIWLLFSRNPVRDDHGKVVGVIASATRLKSTQNAGPTYRRLSQVAERIAAEFNRPLRLRELARLASVSESQLERDFKRLFGLTLRDFLHKIRLEHALRLIETDRSIASIAYECGYADHSAFSRRFRAAIGTTPQHYREAHTRGVPV